MGNMADGLNMQPRIGEPESSHSGAREPAGGFFAFSAPNLPDTSIQPPQPPGAALQQPLAWLYDFDPATGVSRATFNGEIQTGGGTSGVVSWNSRTGAVVLTQADVTAVAVGSFNTRTGAVVLTAADVTGAGGAPLASPALTGTPSAPTAAPATSTTQLATTAFVRTGVTDGSNAAAGQIGEVITATGGPTGAVLATPISIVQITLTPGDWDITGYFSLNAGTNVLNAYQAGISATNNAIGTILAGLNVVNGFTTNSSIQASLASLRVNITVSTTYFLTVAFYGTSASSLPTTATLTARRHR